MFTRRLRPENPHEKKILYVEDEPDIQAIAKIALETIGGFTVRICSSGREALETIGEFNPDCILLDVMMPGMDGPATLKALRQLPGFATTPVVFMTAKVQPREVAEFKALGALDMISKPFNPMTLASTLRQILEGRQ
jgi:CheY-like chemotaxis protein